MKRVWLLRHVKSSWDDTVLADHDRPLAPRGRKAAQRIALWASENGVRPELILCSTALRAQATLELVVNGLGSPVTEIEGRLYHASASDLLARLREVPLNVAEVLIVGHNPSLHELACTLGPPGPGAFPTGALAGLRLEIEVWADVRHGCGTLEEFVVPRSLNRLSETLHAEGTSGRFGARQLDRRAEEDVCTVDAMLPRRVLGRVVADAAGRRHEHHSARDHRREELGVVARSRR